MSDNRAPQASNNYLADVVSMFILVAGVFLVGVLLLFLVKVQRGLLGLILAGLAAALVVYWLREIRQMMKKELGPGQTAKKWNYDILEGKDNVTFVAEVPGPIEDIKVELRDGSLTIFGGDGFKKKVSIPKGLSLIDISYVNGVLNVRLSRAKETREDSPRRDQIS
ncbi:MAG: Hsp20/alpha crystallin family protein [Thaumarchaeota archaeon]|nr:Hsp20/alpha crystallin family protein [Nitrososphaerota archaeon]